jgi:hypothetical protein
VVWRSSSTAWRTASAEAKKRIPFARVDLDAGAVTGIAFGSLIVALFALAWTVYRDIATRSDVRQERTDRKDQLAREEGRREEEIRLLRLQVERQSKSNEATAELVGKSTGWSGDSTGVTFPMSVRNVGSGVARDVIVWLALATDDADAAAQPRVSGSHDLGPLAPNDPASTFSLQQTGAAAGGGVPRDGLIVASWNDGSDHIEAIGKLTVFT